MTRLPKQAPTKSGCRIAPDIADSRPVARALFFLNMREINHLHRHKRLYPGFKQSYPGRDLVFQPAYCQLGAVAPSIPHPALATPQWNGHFNPDILCHPLNHPLIFTSNKPSKLE